MNKNNHKTLLYVIPAALLALGYIVLAALVSIHGVLFFDMPMLDWLRSIQSDALTLLFTIVTNIGGSWGVIAIAVSVVALMLYKKRVSLAIFLTATLATTGATNLLVKHIFMRERPDPLLSLVVETSYSFPSGHAMGSMSLALCVIALSWHTRYRWPVAAAMTLFAVLVGLSRPYFGVHYPSDILAGWCLSGIIFITALLLLASKRRFEADRAVTPTQPSDQ